MNEMKKYKLSDYCLHITDGEHASVDDDIQGDYFLLSNKNIIDGNIIIGKNDRKINEATFDKINKRILLEENDVIISTVGTLGKTAVITGDINYTFQRSVGIIKPNPQILDSFYLKYLLDTDYYQRLLVDLSSGAIQKCIFISTLKTLPISLPPLPVQKKVASVLSSLDKKIALNKQINQNLEALARQLYDYWFVQFDFPNEEGKPYKSSGGKMVYNPILKREIPEGWHCGNLNEIAKFTNGLACQKFRPTSENESLRVIKIREMHEGFSKDTEYVTSNISESVKVYNGDVLFSWSASLEVMLWAKGNGGLNQHIFKVTSANEFPKSFYYYQLLNYVSLFKQMAEARKTTMGHITQDHLEQSRIAIPDDKDITYKLEEKMSPIFDAIINNESEIAALTKQRDELLPLLMNGQVNFDLSDD